MFSEIICDRMSRKPVSLQELADLSGVPIDDVLSFISGESQPPFDVAEHLLSMLSSQLVALDKDRLFVSLDPEVVQPFHSAKIGQAAALNLAQGSIDDILDSDCRAERLDLSYGTIRAYTRGTTVNTGGTLAIWRLSELHRSVRLALHDAKSDASSVAPLQVAAGMRLIAEDNEVQDPVRRALHFMVRAIAAGADPALTRHSANARLVQLGIPWLIIPFKQQERYERALVALKRQGDGSLLVRLLAESLQSMGV